MTISVDAPPAQPGVHTLLDPSARLEASVKVQGHIEPKPIDGLATTAWEQVQPIRQFGFHRKQRRHPGWFYSHASGCLVTYESRLELAHMLVLDFTPGVRRLVSQPMRINLLGGRRAHSHVPDLLVERDGLAPELVNVSTPRSAQDEEVVSRLRLASTLADRAGMGYRHLVGAPPPVLLTNLRHLHMFRGRLAADDPTAHALMHHTGGEAVTFGELIERVGDSFEHRGALMAFIADGRLECDLHRPLRQETLLHVAAVGGEVEA